MRTLMMLASALLLGAGTFCMANENVPFISVAFVVGVVVLFLGLCELIAIRVSVVRGYESASEINAEGLIALILGVVFLSGQVTEGVAVTSLFALWTATEGARSITQSSYDFRANSATDNIMLAIGVITALFGTYMFFNSILFRLPVILRVGISLFLIGMNRFKLALGIEYKAPEFLSGNEEKLAEAKRAEKAAMQKAKEAIRETKAAQARISKLNKEIAKEASLKNDAAAQRAARAEETKYDA